MKRIKLTQGKFALVDNEDFEWLSQWKWTYNPMKYAVRFERKNNKRKMIYMHREILKIRKGLLADHINFNGLDNRKTNLRIATYGQNITHSPPRKTNISGFKGVSFVKSKKKWVVRIMVNGKTYSTKLFDTPKKAAQKYNELAKLLRGNFAYLNKI
jgi:hypothetical protein